MSVTFTSVWGHALLRAVAQTHSTGAFQLLHPFWAHETGLAATLLERALHIPVVVSVGSRLAPRVGPSDEEAMHFGHFEDGPGWAILVPDRRLPPSSSTRSALAQ
jgi:hypothetical protein